MKHVFNFLKAIIIGFISCAVPGLSALTFAIILCVYFPLVEAIGNITKHFKKSIKIFTSKNLVNKVKRVLLRKLLKG